MQHYLAHHHDMENAEYKTTMCSRFGLRIHQSSGKFVRHQHMGESSGKPKTIVPGNLPLEMKVTEVSDNVFACPFCEEKFNTRREANNHTKEKVR